MKNREKSIRLLSRPGVSGKASERRGRSFMSKKKIAAVFMVLSLFPIQGVTVFAQQEKEGTISLYHYDPASLAPYELSNLELAEREINEGRPGNHSIDMGAREMLLLAAGTYEVALAFQDKPLPTIYGDPSRTKHLVGSAGLATFAYAATAGQLTLSDKDLYARSVGFAMALGLAKEMADATGFDCGDLAFDFLGANMGYFISKAVEKDKRNKKREVMCRNFVNKTAGFLEQSATAPGLEEIVVYYSKMYSYALYKQRNALEKNIAKARDLPEFKKAVQAAVYSLRAENSYVPKIKKLLDISEAAWQADRPRVFLSDAFLEEAKFYYDGLKAKHIQYWRALFAGGLYKSLTGMRLDAQKINGYMTDAGFTADEIAQLVR